MRYASDESARLGLDLGFHNCPGWSSSGGPWIYDFGLRVTSSINWPGLTHPAISDALVSELDFTPTLLDLLGLPPMPKTDGISLRPVLQNPKTASAHK